MNCKWRQNWFFQGEVSESTKFLPDRSEGCSLDDTWFSTEKHVFFVTIIPLLIKNNLKTVYLDHKIWCIIMFDLMTYIDVAASMFILPYDLLKFVLTEIFVRHLRSDFHKPIIVVVLKLRSKPDFTSSIHTFVPLFLRSSKTS